MRMLVNLLRPDGGHARVLGVDSRALRREDRQRIGYLSESQTLPERLSVDAFFHYLRSLYPHWDADLERQLRERFELPPARPLGKLSRGMRMKAMLVGVLAFRPKLLLLDEPLSGLDPLVRDEVMSGILAQAEETTILVSSHELEELESCATHVAFMARGQLLFQEAVESLGARLRDVTATLAGDVDRGALPATWLNVQVDGPLLRFLDTAFVDEAGLAAQLQRCCGKTLHLESQALSLRELSKALIRATRREA
jgi:ABC-2 type transport system ATP-binding protein